VSETRLSAAVMLCRGTGEQLEVFLVERNPKLRFFGGYVAFPGGVLDAGEAASGGREAALARCARRELFEETGVLLAAGAIDREERERRRRALVDAERAGVPCDAFDALEAAVAVRLEAFAAITTPPFSPVRFETTFFRAELPAGEVPEIWPGELVGGAFHRPREALAKWVRGELRLAPPVLILLEVLVAAGEDAFEDAAGQLAAAFAAGLLPPVRFSPGIVMAPLATPTLPPATTTNTYVAGNERVYVVDPGSGDPRELERLLTLLASMEEAGREIAGIVLTHHHPDHVGGLAALAAELDVPVHAHPATFDRVPVALDRKGRFERIPLEDGESLPLGPAPDGTPEWRLEALFTPGHARGHLVLHERRYGAALVGDMASTVSTIVIDPPDGHLATYLASLRRLRELALTPLFPAHGPPALDGRRVVDHYLRHRGEREEKLLAALEAGVGEEPALLKVVYSDTDPRMHPYAARSLRAGIDKLIEDGRLAEVEGRLWLVR
jgi:ribonuclease/clavin/mitogillin